MYVQDYFRELEASYPLAQSLAEENPVEITYAGHNRKIQLCEQIWIGLEYIFREQLQKLNIDHNHNFGISSEFTIEYYLILNTKIPQFRNVLNIYFFVAHANFNKDGFYYEGLGKYRNPGVEIKDVKMPKKSIQPLFLMSHELNNLVDGFLNGKIEI